MTVVNRLHVGFPKLRHRILVELTSHCPSELCLIYIPVVISNAGKPTQIELFDVDDLNQRHHEGSQILKLFLKALIQKQCRSLFEISCLVKNSTVLAQLV